MTKFLLLALCLSAAVAVGWAWARRLRAAKQLAEAKAQEASRQKAEAEAERSAEEERLAEEKEKARLGAEIKAQEDARLKAEADAKGLAEGFRMAEERARAEAQAQEEARLKAEADAQARREAEAKAKAESEARVAAEVEARRVTEERRQTEERARAEAEAREPARLAAEAEAQRLAEQNAKSEETQSQPTKESKPEIIPQSRPRDYRPLAQVSPTARQRPNRTRTNRPPQNAALDLRLQIDFGRDGGVKSLALVPERREGMPNQIEINGSRLNAWNDRYYDAVPVENVRDYLEQNTEWRGRSTTRSWRWILSRRELHVLASGDVCGLYQFGSVPRLLLNADHSILTSVALRGDVEAALADAGCSNFAVLDASTPGVPAGWLLLRDVKPTRAVRMRDDAHILNALCPLPDIEPNYVGGIRLTRQAWLAGFAPRIRFTGELAEDFYVTIDGQPAQRAADGAFEAPGWDAAGQHMVWFSGKTDTYELQIIEENWERWHAHDFNTGAAICGGSIHHVAGAKWQQARVPVRNPLLVGARPGEVFFCVMRGDTQCEFLTVLVPFKPVWALPADPAFADKQTSRVVLLNAAEPTAVEGVEHGNSRRSYSMRAWISAIRRAGCKQLALATEGDETQTLWRQYRIAAKQLWRKMR